MCLCSQLCIMRYLGPELLGNPPLVALPLLSFQLMRLPCGRHPLPVRIMYGSMYGGGGGAKFASKVRLWASWFCMDGGDEQAFLRSPDVSANLNPEARDVEEDVVLFQNQFLTCIFILTGDGKGMQAMGGAGSKCWLCKDPNGIVQQMGVESTSRWGSFLRSVTPDRRPGDYQHAACRILNGIAKRTETTLQALPLGTPGKAQALAALQAFKQALKDETSGITVRQCLPSASRAKKKVFDLTSTKVFLTSPPFQRQFVDCLKDHVPIVRSPGGPPLWVVACGCHGKMH